MKLKLATFLMLVAAACSSTSTAAVSPTPSTSPSPTSFVTTLPSASPSPSAADLPLSHVDLSCRLPVMVETTGSNPVSFQGGFVTFPAATFTADSRGRITSTGGGAVLTTAQAPVLNGSPDTGLPAYDSSAGRWLPVGAAQASPDGGSYAYSVIGEKAVHVVSVATGADRTFRVDLASPGSLGINVESFDGAHALLAAGYTEGGPPTGLWRLDIATGAVSRVATLPDLVGVAAGSAWVGYLDPHDPTPPQSSAGYPLFNSLVRVELATGARTTWTYRPGRSLVLNAVDDSGQLVMTVYDQAGGAPPETRHLSAPVQGGEDNGDLVYSGPLSFDVPRIDGDRVWLGNDRGIYLFTPDAGLQKVYAFTGPHQSLFPAGPCT